MDNLETMVAFIVSQADFSVIASAPLLDYELYLEPYGKQRSSARLAMWQEIIQPALMIIGKYAFVVEGCTPSQTEDTTVFTLLPLYKLFSRPTAYSAYTTYPLLYIYMALTRLFIINPDSLYAYPWLSASYNGGGAMNHPGLIPVPDDAGFYDLCDFMQQVAPKVYVDYTVHAGGIELYLEDHAVHLQNTVGVSARIFNTDAGGEIMQSATFKRDIIGRVTHYDPETDTSTDYYLKTDGTVTTDSTDASRVRGRWILYKASNVNAGLIAAQFARSEFSHSLVFSTAQTAPQYADPCRVRLKNGVVVDSRVTSILMSSKTNRLQIKAGSSATTLREIIQEVYST